MLHNKKICGVVVLYNPDESVVENIKSYIGYIDKLYVIDNSDKVHQTLVDSLSGIKKVEYSKQKTNSGIAVALNEACATAIKNGFEYILTMDQDSYFIGDEILNMIDGINIFSDIGIIAPFHENRFSTKKPPKERFSDVLFTKTSGNILSLKAFSDVGKFKEEYFIDYVDIEYCFRLVLNGYRIIQSNQTILTHNEADLSRRKFLGRTVYPWNHNPIRWYYKIRNLFFMKEEYQRYFPDFFKYEISRYLFTEPLKIILYEKKKLMKFRYSIMGYKHYKRGIKGVLSNCLQ